MKRFVLLLLTIVLTLCMLASERADVVYRIREYMQSGMYDQAIEELRGDTTGTYAGLYISLLNMAGHLYFETGQYPQAERYLSEALSLWEPSSAEEAGTYATLLMMLGIIEDEKGDYAEAEQYYFRALAIRKIVVGDKHPDYLLTLQSMADVSMRMGKYAEAEQYLREALAKQEQLSGTSSAAYASLLVRCGELHMRTGNYLKAEQCLLTALAVYRNGSQTEAMAHEYILLLRDLCAVYIGTRDYGRAQQYGEEALDELRRAGKARDAEYAGIWTNLSIVYRRTGDYEQAAHCLQQSEEIYRDTYGEHHPQYAKILNNRGNLYMTTGDYAQAEQYLLHALTIYKGTLGETHPEYATTLDNTGRVYSKTGDYAQAERYVTQSNGLYKQLFLQSIDFMSAQQRAIYWVSMYIHFACWVPQMAYESYRHHHSVSTLAYNNELFLKGSLLQSSETIVRSVIESGDTTLVRQWEALASKKREITALEEKNPQSEQLLRLRGEAEELEKRLTRSSASYRENRQQWEVTWERVKQALKPNQVAIEYMSAPLNKDSTMYCALLLRSNSQKPELIPLFNEKEVSGLLNTSNAKSINATYSYAGHGKALAEHIWGKVLPSIKVGEEVFFSPTGVLHQIAIEHLPYDSTRLMSDVFNMVRLSSTRELVLVRASTSPMHATLYGGIQYDASADALYAESIKYSGLASRSLVNDTLDRGRALPLPGTLKEVEQISGMLRDKYAVDVYTSLSANEESFKALSGTRQGILHLATHGFYWPDETAQQTDYFYRRMLLSPEDEHQPPTIDPLDRCGLLLAGANTALQGHSDRLSVGVQDGVLTAKEISLMDLRGTDIVVLSACETGLGDVTGEGVFGLQRAFKMAGAQTILMALWKVNDEATRMLMTAFYRNYMKGQSKREAFRNAQQEVRNYTVTETKGAEAATTVRDRYKNQGKSTSDAAASPAETVTTQPYQSPYYWAGFIMM